MCPAKLPDGIDRDRSVTGARSTWVPRVVLSVLALLVLLGLLNTFGQRPATTEAATGAATLRVTAPTDLRGGLIFQVRVDVTAHRRLARPVLIFSPGWFDSMTANSIAPQPSTQTSVDGSSAFRLSPIAAGRRATYWFYFQVNPTNVGWRRAENLRLNDGAVPIATIHRTVTIYP
jgi:hypothetical protein